MHGEIMKNKPGSAQVGIPLKVQKSKIFKYEKGYYRLSVINFTMPKNPRRDTHNTRRPLFPQLETTKNPFKKFRFFYFG